MIRPILSRRSRRELYGWERPQKRGGPLASVWMDVRRFWARECVCIYVIRNPAGRCTIRSKSLEVAGRWFTLHLRRCVFSSAATVTVREEKKRKERTKELHKTVLLFLVYNLLIEYVEYDFSPGVRISALFCSMATRDHLCVSALSGG